MPSAPRFKPGPFTRWFWQLRIRALALSIVALAVTLAPSAARAAVVEARTASSADDAEESASGSISLTSSDLELTMDSSNQTVGMRWTGLAIPPGATITSAYIQFTAKDTQSEPTSLVISGQAADHALAFASGVGNVSTRARTVASQSWSPLTWTEGPPTASQSTPDLAAVIQEIVSRSGWASGNALAIVITGTGGRTAIAFDGKATDAPLLHVEFSTVPPVEAPPLAALTVNQTAPLTVRADASGSTDVDLTPIATYAFDFGDGSGIVTTTAPVATATHLYTTSGTYVVSVIVTDSGSSPSAPDTAAIAVTVNIPGSVEKRVALSADDAEESSSGSVSTSNSDLELTMDSSIQTVGIRWPGLAIPAGATITNAYVQFSSKEARTEVTNLLIQGQAIDSAPIFTTSSRSVSTRTRTTASRGWTPDTWAVVELGAKQRTPSVAAVIQEIVSRPGWASGNALALIITGTGRRTAWAWDGKATDAPLLHVDFLIGPPPPDDPPVASLSVTQAGTPPLTAIADASASTDVDLTPIATYRFDFGDGSAAVTTNAPAASASHTYSDVGLYAVQLIVTDTGGHAAAPVSTSIQIVPPPDEPPVARLTVTQLASPQLTVTADASASTDSDFTPIGSYRFDFGDGGAPVTVTAPASTATHTYNDEGVYVVSVIATDLGSQLSAPDTASVVVAAGLPAILDKRVAASSDDVEQPASGSVSLNSSDLELTMDSNLQTVGLRWTGITIPRGARITNAYVQFSSKEAQSEATALVISGQAADNAATFTSASNNVSSRARTSASQNWTPAAWGSSGVTPAQRTPNLVAILQEIVNRPSWASGNALALVITGSGHRTAHSYDGKATEAPLLHVDYLTTQVTVDDPPVARLSVSQASSPALTVTADASASTDVDATPIASYRFDFGDGTTPVTSTSPIASHTYANTTTRTITLLVTDTRGQVSAPATAAFSPTSASPSQVAVYVGYYDTHHPGLTKPKPNPWRGATNVTFVGTHDPGTTNGWDSSALRIDNLGSTTLSDVMVTVSIGSKNFALWGTNTIAPGKTLVLAQTGFENFDGSDTSPAGCYGCSPGLCLTKVVSTQPVVRVTYGGSTTDYVDAGQVLNTKGVDGAGCPYTGTRNDESSNWVRVFPRTAVALQAALSGADSVALAKAAVPAPVLSLAPLAPNPTRGQIMMNFSLPRRGPVRLAIYDLMGREVRTYVDGVLDAGDYTGSLDMKGNAAGMYFFRLWTPDRVLHRTFVVIR